MGSAITISKEEILIRTLASGASLTIPVFHVRGTDDGPKVYIQANIHGPEIAGIGAIHALLGRLREQQSLRGTLTLVPSVNPVGLNSKINGMQVGYADLNETIVGNFNRIYQMTVRDETSDDEELAYKVPLKDFARQHQDSDLATIKAAFRQALCRSLDDMDAKRAPYGRSHGHKLASIIQHLSYDADYLIDLHTAGEAVYHLFTFEECLHGARYFGLDRVILLDDSFSGVLDEAFLQPWLRLRGALAELGRDIPFSDFALEAYTPELGSADHLDAAEMNTDAERILNYLRYKGILSGEALRHAGDYVYCKHDHYRSYRAPTGGLLLWHKSQGDPVHQGETMAVILRPYAQTADGDGQTEIAIVAAEDGYMINRADTQVVHEGLAICSVMTRVQRLE